MATTHITWTKQTREFHTPQGDATLWHALPCRADDRISAIYGKSGTTWMQHDSADGGSGAGRQNRLEPCERQETCQKKVLRINTVSSPGTVHQQLSRRVWQRLHALLARSRQVLRTWQYRHRGRRALWHMEERLLQDIGLSRATAIREASKPFWRS
jgi:uncharacterized protein YjiS (DUF1127 family)